MSLIQVQTLCTGSAQADLCFGARHSKFGAIRVPLSYGGACASDSIWELRDVVKSSLWGTPLPGGAGPRRRGAKLEQGIVSH